MEQLVHLRLKSIYKAFKQSSRSPKETISNTLDADEDDLGDDDVEDPQLLLQAAATAASSSNSSEIPKSSTNQTKDMVDKYMAEKKKADAAAESLLAELEEEEEAVKSKKSKKKKKKEKLQAKREEIRKKEEDESKTSSENPSSTFEVEVSKQTKENEVSSLERQVSEKPSNKAKRSEKSNVKRSAVEYKEQGKKSVEPESIPSESVPTASSKPGISETPDSKISTTEAQLDPVEKELCTLVEANNVDGIENLLNSLKGIPGRAALRKNAKKALKRLKSNEAENDVNSIDAQVSERLQLATESTAASEGTPAVQADVLKIVSDSKVSGKLGATTRSIKAQAGTPKAECVMQMSPAVVGWVIGKGGQRIRELMEASGAKIWIAQGSVNPNEPRTVYVSGSRKCVDVAIRMVKDLVAKAPMDEKSGQNQKENPLPILGATAGKDPIRPAQAVALTEKLPLKKKNVTAVGKDRNQPYLQTGIPHALDEALPTASSIKEIPEAGLAVRLLTCEPRFVPLLIGRRGWTIKHIQDSSGARVDIDQSVTPRQIKISGDAQNVDTAAQMVEDVLKYPHAQLHTGCEADGLVNLNGVDRQGMDDIQRHLSVALSVTEGGDAGVGLVNDTNDRIDSPPPSTLIMTGDGKSLISASSSLSSTPEPSMGSTAKGYSGQLSNGPLIPPEYGYSNFRPPPPSTGSGFITPEMSIGDAGARQASALLGPNNAPLYGGHVGLHHPQAYGIPPPQHAYGQVNVHPAPLIPTMMPEQHNLLGGVAGSHMPQQMLMRVESTQARPLEFSGLHVPGNRAPLHQQQSSFSPPLPPPPQYLHQEQLPDTGINTIMNMRNNSNRSAFNGASDPTVPAGLWDRSSAAHVQERGQPQPVAGLFLDTLNLQNRGLVGSGAQSLDFDAGLLADEARVGLTGDKPARALDTGRDDSRMVDSLFAPAIVPSVSGQQNLLPGFQGLSINDDGLDAGVWNSSLPAWSNGQGTSLAPASKVDHIESTLLAGLQPLQASQEYHHPTQSRFHWGSTNA